MSEVILAAQKRDQVLIRIAALAVDNPFDLVVNFGGMLPADFAMAETSRAVPGRRDSVDVSAKRRHRLDFGFSHVVLIIVISCFGFVPTACLF